MISFPCNKAVIGTSHQADKFRVIVTLAIESISGKADRPDNQNAINLASGVINEKTA